MFRLLTSSFFLLLFLHSCTNVAKKQSDLRSFASEYVDINGITLPYDSIIASANIVAFFDDKIITRIYGDHIFTIYQYDDIHNNISYIGDFGKRGSGPFEFAGPAECFYDVQQKQLYLFDIQGDNVRTYRINLDSLDNLFDTATWEIITFPTIENAFLTSFIPISENSFIALGGNLERSNLLSIINSGSDSMEDLEISYPNDGIKVEPITKRFVYNYGGLLKRPSTNDFIYYCTNWGNYAEIIKFDKGVSQKAIVANYPKYKLANDGMNSESEMQTLMGMRSYVTDKYIYLLPNFKTKEEFVKGENGDSAYSVFHMDKIYVFDWEGNYVKAYRLKVPIMQHVVKDDKHIIGSSVDPESGDIVFVKFDI